MRASNSSALEAALRQKLADLTALEYIAGRARDFFQGLPLNARISKAQMAAVGDRILRQSALCEAESATIDFIKRQMAKLEKHEVPGAKTSSWGVWVEQDDGRKRLGCILIDWIEKKRYLPAGINYPEQSPILLQRFWSLVETLYHYHGVVRPNNGKKKEICP